jgi:CheY-like chemotaxis protein
MLFSSTLIHSVSLRRELSLIREFKEYAVDFDTVEGCHPHSLILPVNTHQVRLNLQKESGHAELDAGLVGSSPSNVSAWADHSPHPSSTTDRRVLLIEDDDTNRQMLGDFLTLSGYITHGIATGAELQSALSGFCPGVILMDIKLPDINGFTLLSQLSSHPEWSAIPVIVVSAYALRADRAKALDMGASQYFVKPVELDQLMHAIDVELRRFQRRSPKTP